MTEQRKKYLQDSGILLGCIILLFSILFVIAIFSRNHRNSSLKNDVVKILEANYPGIYTIIDFYSMQSGFSAKSAAFKLANNKHPDESGYVVLINITTIYGPYPAVFIYTDGDVKFIDLLCIEKEHSDYVATISTNSFILYWKRKIPQILSLQEGSIEK